MIIVCVIFKKVAHKAPVTGENIMKKILIISLLSFSSTLFAAEVAQTIATQGAKTAVTGSPQGATAPGGGGAGCLPVGQAAVCAGGNLAGGSVGTAGVGAGVRVGPNAAVGVGVAQDRATGNKSAAVGFQANFGGTKPR